MSFSYLVSKTVSHPSTFIKKAMFDKYGVYNEENKIISDWEFFFKALGLNGESYQKIDYTITNFDMAGISSSEIEKVKNEKEIVLKSICHISLIMKMTAIFLINFEKRINVLSISK